MKNFIRAFCCGLTLMATELRADPVKHVIGSLETLDIVLDTKTASEIASEVDAARERVSDKLAFDRRMSILADMATLSRTAQRAATRVRLADMHRQLLEDEMTKRSVSTRALEQQNPLIIQIGIGLGLTKQDLSWAVMLEAMRQDLPEDPRHVDIAQDESKTLANGVIELFRRMKPGGQHFLASIDAWASGTMTAWHHLSDAERRFAVSILQNDSLPGPDLLQKIIGTQDLVFWLSGLDIGLTDAEKNQYPHLTQFIEQGHMAGGMGIALEKKLAEMGLVAEIGAQTNLTLMMMELNYDLLFDHDLLGFD